MMKLAALPSCDSSRHLLCTHAHTYTHTHTYTHHWRLGIPCCRPPIADWNYELRCNFSTFLCLATRYISHTCDRATGSKFCFLSDRIVEQRMLHFLRWNISELLRHICARLRSVFRTGVLSNRHFRPTHRVKVPFVVRKNHNECVPIFTGPFYVLMHYICFVISIHILASITLLLKRLCPASPFETWSILICM
jgi:hypothetical protein